MAAVLRNTGAFNSVGQGANDDCRVRNNSQAVVNGWDVARVKTGSASIKLDRESKDVDSSVRRNCRCG